MASARATPRQQAVHRKPLLNVVLDSSVHRSSDLAFGIASHEERDQSGGTSLMRRVSSGPLIPGITTSVRSRSISVPRLLATYAASSGTARLQHHPFSAHFQGLAGDLAHRWFILHQQNCRRYRLASIGTGRIVPKIIVEPMVHPQNSGIRCLPTSILSSRGAPIFAFHPRAVASLFWRLWKRS